MNAQDPEGRRQPIYYPVPCPGFNAWEPGPELDAEGRFEYYDTRDWDQDGNPVYYEGIRT